MHRLLVMIGAMPVLPRLLGTLVLLGACQGWDHEHVNDEGTVCLLADAPSPDVSFDAFPPPQKLADGAPLFVRVIADGCYSGSCTRHRQGKCETMVHGDNIFISSEFTWQLKTGDVQCTTDCIRVNADCQVPPLPAGSYTVYHGKTTRTIDVPSVVGNSCN